MPSLATRGAGTIKGFGFAGAGVPGSPTGVYTNGVEYQKATINFSAPASNGGLAITGYRVTSSGGQVVNGTSSPIIVTGLTNGTSYTFTVQAINSAGPSVASSSTSVTPNIPNVNVILSRSTGDYTYVPPYTMNVAIMAIGGGSGGGGGGYTGDTTGGGGGGCLYMNSFPVTGGANYPYSFYNVYNQTGGTGGIGNNGNGTGTGQMQGNDIYFRNSDSGYVFYAAGGRSGSGGSPYIWTGYTAVTRNGGSGGGNGNAGGGGGAAGTTGNGGNGAVWTNTSSPPYQATVAQAGSGNGGGGGGVGTGYGTYGGAGGGGFKAAGGTASHGSSDAANIHLGGAAGSGGFALIQGGQGGGGSGYNGSGYSGGAGGNIGGGGGGGQGFGGNGGPGVLVILEGVGRSIEPYA
jgi:hypothetical protein